jgi:hypothetical protein
MEQITIRDSRWLRYGGGPDVHVTGWVSPEVERVEISFAGGVDEPRGIFIAFLPAGVEPSAVTATAYSAEADSLGTATWPEIQAPD